MLEVETHPRASQVRDARTTHAGARWSVPVLEPGGSVSDRLARTLRSLHPALVFVVVMLGGFAVIVGISILLGLLTTHVIEPSLGIGAANERVNVWLAQHRTPARTDASLIGSIIAGGVVLPIIAAVAALLFGVLRKWRLAAFSAFALAVESGTYRATTFVVHSHRPRVARLEDLPVNASYPSGHTAAAIAVYGGLALLLASRFRNATVRAVAWSLVVAIVAFVATARMYRGMHHPLDVAGAIVVGILAVCVIVTACRASAAVARAR